MKKIYVGSIQISTRPSCVATFNTIYGIGITKAKRLNAFLLAHPTERGSSLDFTEWNSHPVGRSIMYGMPVAKRLRISITQKLKKQFVTYCYKAFRMFQGLPANGQRTHANGKTPRRYSQYLHLQGNKKVYDAVSVLYKRKELFLNGRVDELKAYTKFQLEKQEQSKAEILLHGIMK